MFKLYINGIDYTEDVINLDEFTINIGFNDTNTITKGLSESVIVEGEAFLLLEKTFFLGCNSYTKELNAMFVADVCSSINIPLKINIDGLRYDPANGQMEILLKSITDEDKAYNILDSSFWHENGFESAYKIPLMYFIEQPNYIQWAILILTLSLRIVFNALDKVIEFLCNIISLGGLLFDCPEDYTSAIFKLFDNWLFGVGNWGTAPLIREIIEYQCGHAGISFSSSIINDPASEYFNIAMFSLDTGDHGTHKETSDNKRKAVLKNNANLMTVIELLEGLKTTFEGTDYRIIDKVLYFEKTEYFDQIASIKILDVIGNCEITAPKYEYDLNELVAWGQFQFTQDSDVEGNKSAGYYKINKDYNNPYSSAQKGSLQRLIPFAPSSFQFDQRSFYKSFGDITGVWDAIKDAAKNWELMLDIFRAQRLQVVTGLDWFGTEGLVRENDIVLTGKMTSVPKLLILEDNFNRNDTKVIKKLLKQQGLVKFYVYNFPLMYKEKVDEVDKNDNYTEAIEGSLVSWAVRADPRQKNDNIKVSNITTECTCDAIQDILLNYQKIYIATHKGKGIPRNTTIKLGKSKIEITYNDIRVLCSN